MSRYAPGGQVTAEDLLVFPEALAMHEAMTREGFALRPLARARYRGMRLSVRLVWRRPSDGESAVLCLQING